MRESGTGIVGRAIEVAGIGAALDATAARHGGVLAFVGEAGVGKSLLLSEVTRQATARGFLVARGRAVSSGGTYRALAGAMLGAVRRSGFDPATLGPYRSAMAALVPHLGPPPGADSGVDQAILVGEGVLRILLHDEPAGAVLVLDDVHWADAETIAVVEYLSDAIAGEPVLICVAARDEPHIVPRLTALPNADVHTLRRLDEAELLELATASAGRPLSAAGVDYVAQHSAGLPLLVAELAARIGADDEKSEGPLRVPVPESFRALVAERVERLSRSARTVVEAAAVVGVELGWNVIGAAAGVSADDVAAATTEATACGLFAQGDGTLDWRHALVADAVLASVVSPRRLTLALRAADLLDTGGVSESDSRAADLLAAAGAHDRAARVELRLARAALTEGALRAGRTHLDRIDPSMRGVEWAVERVRLSTMAGAVGEARIEGAAALDRATGTDHAELCLQLARTCIAAGRWAEADTYVTRAGRPGDPRSDVLRADASYGAGDRVTAARYANSAVEQAESAGDHESLIGALLVVGRCRFHTDPTASARAFGTAVQVAAEHGAVPLRVSALCGAAIVEALDRHDPPSLRAARVLAVEAGLLGQVATIDALAADLAASAWGPAAEAAAAQCATLAGRLKLPGVQAFGEMGIAAARAAAGDEAAAAAGMRSALARADAAREVQAAEHFCPAIARTVHGDLTNALTAAEAGVGVLAQHGSAAPTHWWGLWLLLRVVLDREVDEARARFLGTNAPRRLVNRGALACADAVVAGRRGDSVAHTAAVAAADTALEAHPWWHHLLRTVVATPAVAEGWGDPVAMLRADLGWLEHAGSDALAQRCRDLLRVAGAPQRRRTTPIAPELGSLGITSREAEVLPLVAAGLTNQEIAARLFLSVRTVDTHVARLLAKTGSSSRTQLRTYVAGENP